MAKWRGDSFYDLHGRPAGPPTQKEVNRFGIEEAWLRWSFFFGRDPVARRSRLEELQHRSPDYATLPEVGLCMVLPRRTTDSGSKRTSSSAALAAGALKEYSELWTFLTASVFPDGAKRKTGRLSLSCDAGALVLSLNDPESTQYATFQGTSLDDLLLTAEAKMAADEVNWRKSKFPK